MGSILLGTLLGVVALAGVITAIGWVSAFEKTQGGEVAIVRNGGLFDNNKIRGYIPEASERINVGMWSNVHRYPAQQRFYKISANAKESDTGLVDQVNVPTSNGVNVGIEGTIYFELNTSEKVLKEFDEKFGTRRFAGEYPWNGDEGFAAWLNTVLRPVIDNNLRKEIGSVTCAELIPSCALVQNEGNLRAIADNQGVLANQKIAEIEDKVNSGLKSDIQSQLGGEFLTGIRFTLAKAVPPVTIQRAIDEAQAAFASVSKAEAKKRSAEIEADANRIRQRGYENCPACAQIDMMAAIPKNVTTFAPGAGFAVTPK